MRTGAKAAAIIVSVVGLGGLLMVALVAAIYFGTHGKFNLGSLGGHSLSDNNLPIVMHDDNDLATRTVRFQTLDADYLIDLTATMDATDTAAGNNMTAAAKKIKVNP